MEYLYITLGLVGLAGLLVLCFAGLIQLNKYLIQSGKNSQVREWVVKAIVIAYKVSDSVFDVTQKRLYFEQKEKVIRVVYDMLPDSISLGKFQLPWKKWVTTDAFVSFVNKQYDEIVESYTAVNKAILKQMVESIPSTERDRLCQEGCKCQ